VDHLRGVLLGFLRPYLQTIEQAGKVCQEPTLLLSMKMCKLWTKKFYGIGPRKKAYLGVAIEQHVLDTNAGK